MGVHARSRFVDEGRCSGWGAVDIETFVIGAVVGTVVGALVVYWLGRRRRSGYPALWRRGAAPNGHGASVQWVDTGGFNGR
jgi:membrane protein DedA with SNARE-associated domain